LFFNLAVITYDYSILELYQHGMTG